MPKPRKADKGEKSQKAEKAEKPAKSGPGFADAPNSDPTMRERVPPPPKNIDLTPPKRREERRDEPREAPVEEPEAASSGLGMLVPMLAFALIAAIAVIAWLLTRG